MSRWRWLSSLQIPLEVISPLGFLLACSLFPPPSVVSFPFTAQYLVTPALTLRGLHGRQLESVEHVPSPAIQRDLLVPSLPMYLGGKQYLGSKMEHPHGWGT